MNPNDNNQDQFLQINLKPLIHQKNTSFPTNQHKQQKQQSEQQKQKQFNKKQQTNKPTNQSSLKVIPSYKKQNSKLEQQNLKNQKTKIYQKSRYQNNSVSRDQGSDINLLARRSNINILQSVQIKIGSREQKQQQQNKRVEQKRQYKQKIQEQKINNKNIKKSKIFEQNLQDQLINNKQEQKNNINLKNNINKIQNKNKIQNEIKQQFSNQQNTNKNKLINKIKQQSNEYKNKINNINKLNQSNSNLISKSQSDNKNRHQNNKKISVNNLELAQFQQIYSTNQIIDQNNQDNQSNQNLNSLPNNIKNNKKKIILLISLLILTGLLLIIAAFKCWFQNSLCPIIDPPPPIKVSFIVDPQKRFKPRQCTQYNYTVSNAMQNQTFQQQYVAVFCVRNITKNQIHFLSSIEKSKQQSNNNQPVIYETYYDKFFFAQSQNNFNNLIINDNSTNISDNTDNDSNQTTSIQMQNIDSTENNSIDEKFKTINQSDLPQMATLQFTHPIFRFSIDKNGSIIWLSFPKKGDKHLKTLLKSFIQSFAPLIDISLYEQQGNQTVIQNHRRLLQLMKDTNGNNQNSQIYSTDTTDNNSIVLKSQQIDMTQNEDQHTECVADRDFSFSDNGTMLTSNANAQTSFISQSTEESTDFEIMNLNQLNFQANQSIGLTFVLCKQTKEENMKAIIDLASQNQTLNFTISAFDQYLSKTDNSIGQNATTYDQQKNKNLTRLLYETEDGSIRLSKLIEKQYYIIKVKPIGVEVSYKVYTDISIRMRADPKNQIKKIPFFNLDIGSILVIGPLVKQKIPFVSQQKQLPPLSLRYTLDQVEKVLSFLKPSFLNSITEIFGQVIEGNIDEILHLKSFELGDFLDKLLIQILKEYDLMDPYNIIKKVIKLVKQVKNGIEDKGVSQIINIKKPIILSLTNQIKQYCDNNFADAVAAFEQFKDGIDQYENQGIQVINSSYNKFMSKKDEYLLKAKGLITQQLEQLYNVQMRKALPIIQNLDYVQKGIKDYSNNFNENYLTHQNKLFVEIQQLLSSYLNKTQQNLTNIFVSKVQQIETKFKNQYKDLITPFQNFIQSVDNNAKMRLAIIGQSTQLTSIDWNKFFTDYFEQLSNQADTASFYAVGSCCDRDFWGRCNYRSPVEHQTRAQKTIYNAFRISSQSTIKNILNITQMFVKQVNTSLNDMNVSVKEKIYKIKQLSSTLIGANISLVKQQTQNRINNALYLIYNRCGVETWPMDNYYNSLLYFRSKLLQFEVAVNKLKQRQSLFNIDFTVGDYQLLQHLIKYSQQMIEMNNTIISYVNDGYNGYKQLINYKNKYNIQQFLFPKKQIIQQYNILHGLIKSNISTFCYSDNDFKTNISKIKQTLNKKITQSQQLKISLASKPYINDLSIISTNIQSVYNVLFNQFNKIKLCEYSNNTHKLINQTTIVLINQFKQLQIQYLQFDNIWKSSMSNFSNLINETKTLISYFYNLRNVSQYEKYIKKTDNYTYQVRQLYHKCTRKMANIRQTVSQKISNMNYTQYYLQSKLQSLISPFRYLLSQYSIDNQCSQFIMIMSLVYSNKNISIHYKLCQLVVTGKYIKKSIQQTISQFQLGIKQYKNFNFIVIFDQLFDLTSKFTSSQLLSINNKLTSMKQKVQKIIYPQLISINKAIVQYGSNISIERQQYLQMYNKNLQILNNYVMNQLIENKQSLQQKILNLTDIIYDRLNRLRLSDYIKLKLLGQNIIKQFNKFDNEFKIQLQNLLQLQQIVGGNFEKLFNVNNIINTTFYNIKLSYLNSTLNINQLITSTISTLQLSFLQQFKLNSLYSNIKSLNNQMIVNFNSIQLLVNSTLQQIQTQFNILTQQFKNKLLQLNQIKQDFKSIKNNIQSRINHINQNFKQAKKGLLNIKNLLFSVLKDDINQYIMKYIDSVFIQVDLLIQQDLKTISIYAKNKLPQSIKFLTQPLNQVISHYQKVKQQRTAIQLKIIQTIQKLQTSIQSTAFNKFSNLKQAQLYIKGKVQDFVDQGSVILYQQDLYNISVPIVKVIIPIPVVIGVFYVEFALNYTLGIKFAIGIINYRDIDANVTFGAGLVLYASFSWGIKYIIQIGVFVRGPILRAQIKPRLLIQGLIPIQLVKFITNVPQITNKNAVKVYGQLYFGLYGLEMQIGFFLKFFTIELIWLRISFCIRLLFFKFCINFKIPIGIIFKPKRWQWATPFAGIGKQFRLARVKMLEIGY